MVKKQRLSHEQRKEILESKNIPYNSFIEHYQWLGRAYKYQQANPYDKPLYIFGMDKKEEGKNFNNAKWWVLASLPAFRNYIFSLDKFNRHGNCLTTIKGPLFCFMDLEFEKKRNLTKNVDLMMSTLFKCFDETWQEVFPKSKKTITRDDFLILESSNDEKYSFHAHGPFHHAFSSTFELRAFMKLMVRHIDAKYSEILMVRKKSDTRNEEIDWCFIDKMVYRNHKPVSF